MEAVGYRHRYPMSMSLMEVMGYRYRYHQSSIVYL